MSKFPGLIKLEKEDERRIKLEEKYRKERLINSYKHPHDPTKKDYPEDESI